MSDKVVIKGSMNLRNAINGTPNSVIPVGTNNYEALTNKPSINSVTLEGNKTAEDLGLASEAALEVERARIDNLIALPDGSITLAKLNANVFITSAEIEEVLEG